MYQAGDLVSGRFEVLDLLGKGGMASVFRVFDRERQGHFALKVCEATGAQAERRRERFVHEYEVVARLDNPHIVKVFDLVRDGQQPAFTMEILDGEDAGKMIAQRGEENPCPVEEALVILDQLAEALAYLHSQAIVYCDLKPANIIVRRIDNAVRVTLVDFGIARAGNEDSPVSGAGMVGTSLYMSPEQIRGEPLDQRTDIYSFGATAFELITGRVPFKQEALFNVTASHLIGKVPSARELNKSVPTLLDRVLRVCMEKERSDRYQSMEELKERIERLRSGRGSFTGWLLEKVKGSPSQA